VLAQDWILAGGDQVDFRFPFRDAGVLILLGLQLRTSK
jgi:hypothetical protein